MSFPSFPLKKILILLILLAVPGTVYYLLKEKGINRYRPLPIYGEKQVAKTFTIKRRKQVPDTIYHVIRNFKFLNQKILIIKIIFSCSNNFNNCIIILFNKIFIIKTIIINNINYFIYEVIIFFYYQ